MKVKVVFALDPIQRRAIAHRYGQTGLASHHDCQRVLKRLAEADLEILVSELPATGEDE